MESTEASHWITVFGFPLSLASLVLQQFESDGEIVQYMPGQGLDSLLFFFTPTNVGYIMSYIS